MVITALVFFAISGNAQPVTPPAALKYSVGCLLKAVATKKNIALRSDVPLPKVFFESSTPLQQFQDAVEPQWNMRPEAFTNVYIATKNEIYLMDDGGYYARTHRYIDDSLAHELTHYMQYMYQHVEMSGDDTSLEMDAVDIQTRVREEFMNTDVSPCGGAEMVAF